TPPATRRVLRTPSATISHLDRFAIGQPRGKRDPAAPVDQPHSGQPCPDNSRARHLGRAPLLELRPTGNGNTCLVRARARLRGAAFGFARGGSPIASAGLPQAEIEDLEAFGFIPELLGRFSTMTTLEELDVSALVRILTECERSVIRQQQDLFRLHGIELAF